MLLNQNQAFNILRKYKKCMDILYSRHFHISHILHPRKPASSRKIDLLPSSEKPIDLMPPSQKSINFDEISDNKMQINSNKNFYGIEGDDGVIIVNETSHFNKSTTDLSENKKALEKEFRFTTFGAVRLDVENEPLHIPKNYKRPRNKSINSDIVAEKYAKTLSDTNIPNISDETKQFQSFIDANKVKNSSITDNSNSGSNYFYNNSLNNLPNKEESVYQRSLQNDKISNYIDNLYFSNEINGQCVSNTEVQQKKPKISSENNRKQSQDQTLSDSFIDSFYFPSDVSNSDTINDNNLYKNNSNMKHLQESELSSYNEDIINAPQDQSETLNDNAANQFSPKSSSNFKQSSVSYIDEFYFPEQTVENSTEDNKKNKLSYIDEQYFDEIFPNTYSGDVKNSINNTEESISTDCIKQSDIKTRNGLNSNITTDKKVDDYTIHNSMNSRLPFERPQKTLEFQSQNIENLSNKRKLSDKFQNNFAFKTNFTSKNLNSSYEELYKTEEMSPRENLKIKNKSNEVLNENLNPIVDENTPVTAYDFVKKLQEKKFMSDEVKKGISAKKEKKLDSKGFRILKHQVPTLKYFTRDEILELLKESILHIDDDIVVLNKPYNLVIHESSTSADSACLSMYLADFAKMLDPRKSSPELFTVHRLDKETTGCLLLARNEMSSQRLKSLFAQRQIMKTYWIVTCKIPDPMEGVIDIPISEGKVGDKSRMVLHPDLPSEIPYKSHSKPGKRAVTHYKVIATSGNAALVEVRPETGIKHQIRVHFGLGLSCPILGDHKYSYLDKIVPQKLSSDLLQRLQVRQSKVRHIPLHIHSKQILIPQYSEERNLFVTAPLPHHISENLRFLKFKKK